MSEVKRLSYFDAECVRCGATRKYCATQTELGRVDVAVVRWCECSLGGLVQLPGPLAAEYSTDEGDPEPA